MEDERRVCAGVAFDLPASVTVQRGREYYACVVVYVCVYVVM